MDKNRTKKDRKMQLTANSLGERIGGWLRRSALSPGRLAHRLAADPRAVKNWYAGINAPRATEILKLMAESQEFADEINRIVMEMRVARTD